MRRLLLAALAARPPFVLGRTRGRGAPGPEPTPTPRLFDPRRPPRRSSRRSIADGFTLAAVGDLIMERPLSQLLPARSRLRAPWSRSCASAGAALRQLRERRDRPRPHSGRTPTPAATTSPSWRTPPSARDLAKLGFDIVSRANNHAMDWGVEGMRETTRLLDAAGLVHAGVGEDRGEARAARYLETPQGRVALVSMASTFSDWSDATAPRGPRTRAGRGCRALRVTRSFVLPRDALREAPRRQGGAGRAREGLRDRERGRAREPREGRQRVRVRREADVPRRRVPPGRPRRCDTTRWTRSTATRSSGPSARASSIRTS